MHTQRALIPTTQHWSIHLLDASDQILVEFLIRIKAP